MKANAFIRLKLPSERHLKIVLNALKPEVKKAPTKRSRTILKRQDTSLILKIEAEDTVALRATVNTYLRWIDTLRKVLEVLQNISQQQPNVEN